MSKGITINREPAYLVASHPRCVAAGTCQGSCSEGGIDYDVHVLLDGPGDALGLPSQYGEVIQSDEMTCSLGMVKDGAGGPEMLFIPVP